MSVIDETIFQQLLDMDDDDQHEFSKSLLQDYFTQLDDEIPKFTPLIAAKDYDAVGKQGHFLKGSSAGIGAEIIREICEEINHYTLNSSPENYGDFLSKKVQELKDAVPIAKQEFYSRMGLE